MKQAIVNFCNSTDTGLFLLDMPTGFGKTYSVLEFMAENYDTPDFCGIIKLREGLPKFMRGFRDGLAKNFVDFMRFSSEGIV